MVEKHIKSLLYDHDCVIIPEFGGLITRYVSACMNPVKHSLAPPSKTIAFNEKLVLNDGLLISTIAYRNNITKEEAQRLVSAFVYRAKVTLQNEDRFILRDVGVFKYNPERKLEFEYVAADNFLEASFGLPDLVLRPIRVEEPAMLRTLLKERQQEPFNMKQPLRKRLKRAYNVAAGLALTGLTASALYFFSLQTPYNLSSLNPIMLFSSGFNITSATPDKYSSDYVPFTEEERATAYQSFLPSEAAAEPLAEEYAAEEGTDAASEALVDLNNTIDNEEVAQDDPVVEETKTIAPVLTINGKTGRFYIITGGYSTLQNAEASRTVILKKGEDSKVLLPGAGSRLFRVSVADFATEAEAHQAITAYKKSFGETIWVFNY